MNIEVQPITLDFKTPIDEIGYILNSTNDEGTVKTTNGVLRLLQNRTYYIPIKKTKFNIDTDNPNITVKAYSTYADKIDIKFVKDNYVAIECIRSNIVLKTDETIGFATWIESDNNVQVIQEDYATTEQ